MNFEKTAILLSAESKPYKMAGNEGVSHKARFNVGGEIYSCNSSAEQITSLLPHVGKEGDAEFFLASRKENLSLKLVSFDVN